MKGDKAKNAAKTKTGEKKAKAKGMRDLNSGLAVATKIRGGRIALNHVELALVG